MTCKDFFQVSEISGDDVTLEQVERHARRYYWAADYCRGRDVLEVACGTGQGVGYLSRVARSVTAGDYSGRLLRLARNHYGDRFQFHQFDAQEMPYPAGSFDVVVLFEALYYIPDATKFFVECRRVLRPEGVLLLASANKDLFDFNPSPHSTLYLGVVELTEALQRCGFRTEFFGDTAISAISIRQRLTRPAKAVAAKLGLIPKSMDGKKLLKRLVFGRLVTMPPEITPDTAPRLAPVPLAAGGPARDYKVLFCAATRTSATSPFGAHD